jgi:tetratricopeptide (TPR) repeat protein
LPTTARALTDEADRMATSPQFRPASRWLAPGMVCIAAWGAYGGSLNGEFVYDDLAAIVGNPSIRHLGWHALRPPDGLTTSGRPLVNLSFALNHALGGLGVGGYHLANLLIHAAAGLVLLGLVRRTLDLPGLAGRFRRDAGWLALAAALLWTVHPLQTEAVTYVVQRVESLMGFFYLLTLYCLVRAGTAGSSRGWLAGSVAACAAGMACKEVMVSAPVVSLLLDRACLAGSFRAAWRQRAPYYLALAATWLLLLALVHSTGWNRGGTVGAGTSVGWWDYLLTQFRALPHYLRLSAWPHPLAFDYGTFWERDPAALLPQMILVVGLAVAALAALRFRPRLGLLGAAFWAPLAPTTLLPGTTQMIVEHRMYLSLAPVVVGLVLAGHALLGRRALLLAGAAAIALVPATAARNRAYRTGLMLWGDTVAKVPGNARAHCNLGIALAAAGRPAEAVRHYDLSLQLEPNAAQTHYNRGVALARLERWPDALQAYARALALSPDLPEALCNQGAALLASGQPEAAIGPLQRARGLRPDDAEIAGNLGNALAQAGRAGEALPHYAAALRLQPGDADLHFNRGQALLSLGRAAEARADLEAAVRLRPSDREFRAVLEALRSR